METFWERVLEFCQRATATVGDRAREDFGKLQATNKSDGTLVTEADRRADKELRTLILAEFPDHGVLTEETTHVFPENDWCWVVDPIDGTTNFTRGVPIWGISLGLLYQGTPVFGFVYLPCLRQSYHGYWYGDTGLTGPTGAYRDGEPIHASDDFPSKNHLFNLCARSTDILKNPFPCKVRMIGVASYNLLLVADGTALGGVEAIPKAWDMAAVWAIVQAAGGVFISLGEPIFPLKAGVNYGDRSFPSLAVARSDLVPVFLPLVGFLRNSA
ncbi:inositol monophosphatase family protein [Pannus brasiliensis CCIBt3594]|uniref:inositol-phosphate phosphatase n=1 Tax=Pannus brasiliensis CCIBt3594 TaxID=1427578 RepID=A0AAW9QZD5_9CHRO